MVSNCAYYIRKYYNSDISVNILKNSALYIELDIEY